MKRPTGTLAFFAMFIGLAAASCGAPEDDEVAIGTTEQSLSSDQRLDEFRAEPPHRVRPEVAASPAGISPAQLRTAYGLPSTGGAGTIAIVDAYDNARAESDLAVFSSAFGLPPCTTANGCFRKVKMGNVRGDQGWALEIALDIQWAHAVAPSARILLVEARSNSGTDLLAAVDYARSQADVVAISLSWGGGEFSGEAASDARFTSAYGAVFFAASGDNGTGIIWPSVSPNVVAVGGTRLTFNPDGTLAGETAWSGSGGGISAFEPMPAYQSAFGLTGTRRLVPDVSANADPASGYSVYDSNGYYGQKGWFTVGGTSGSTPVWAGIRSLGLTASNPNFYEDAAVDPVPYFRDIVSGTNGSCGTNCTAAPGYDLVTGLGSPLTVTY
ncbi:MAG TPA: S53 family peptidase [Candidatus Eisenbacteria bacterium]|nr:S53 family peptidase [Candidatus Eisenbacteria bacterium]